MSDAVLKFLLGDGHVRGVAVRLEDTWQTIRERRNPPSVVEPLLGEMSAAAALLAGSLKFDGSLILQIQGDGALRLAVAECQPDFGLRATAKFEAGALPDAAELPDLVNAHGHGRCAITLDPRNATPGQQPYQGIVALNDAEGKPLRSLTAMLQQYLAQSEQIDSFLMLAANQQAACGLLLQRMPGAQVAQGSAASDPDEDFRRAHHLAATLTADELLALPSEEVLRRLFWEEGVRVFDPLTPRFHCTCSRERVANMLRMLGKGEVDSILAEQGDIEVDCEFCGQHYTFDAVDAAQLNVQAVDQPPVEPGQSH